MIPENNRQSAQRRDNTAGIDHVALKVADLETATRFYETVFGFRRTR